MGILLEGHIAVISGAGSGIGRAIVKGFAAEGAKVMAADINEAGAAETAAMITDAGGTALSSALDVTDRASCAALADKVSSGFGQVSLLVNNAGITRDTLLPRMSDDEWDAEYDPSFEQPSTAAVQRKRSGAKAGVIKEILHRSDPQPWMRQPKGQQGQNAVAEGNECVFEGRSVEPETHAPPGGAGKAVSPHAVDGNLNQEKDQRVVYGI